MKINKNRLNGKVKKKKQAHAKQRAFQRYGINLTRKLRKHIVGLIKEGRTKLLEVQSTSREVHYIEEDEYYVVYDNKKKDIVTFLYGAGGKVLSRFESGLIPNKMFIFPI